MVDCCSDGYGLLCLAVPVWAWALAPSPRLARIGGSPTAWVLEWSCIIFQALLGGEPPRAALCMGCSRCGWICTYRGSRHPVQPGLAGLLWCQSPAWSWAGLAGVVGAATQRYPEWKGGCSTGGARLISMLACIGACTVLSHGCKALALAASVRCCGDVQAGAAVCRMPPSLGLSPRHGSAGFNASSWEVPRASGGRSCSA